MATAKIPLEKARNIMAAIWFPGSFIPFFILTVQTIVGKYGADVQAVWGWFLPTVSSTLALILGVIGSTALTNQNLKLSVKPFFFHLSTWLAVAYLLILTMTVALQPFVSGTAIELYSRSNFYLGPIQGLAVAALTVMFTSPDKATAAPPPAT